MMMAWIGDSVLPAVTVSPLTRSVPHSNQMCEPVKYQSCNICRSKPRRIIGDSQKYTHQQIISGVTANCDPKTPQEENTGKKQPGSGPKGKTEQVKSVGLRPDVVCEGKQETG
jgi:hypothetical protein